MPFSAVYPYYSMHITAGMYAAVNQCGYTQNDFEIIPVYIGQGQHKMVQEAVQKLLFFEGVDVVTGMVNIKVLTEISPLLDNYNKLGLFIDFGEIVHPTISFGKNVGCLSMNYWQSEYALGKWAVNEFGPDGQIILPIYESGFDLHYAFLQGGGSSGSEALHQMVLTDEYVTKDQLNLVPFFEAIEKDEPNFVHAIFTGSLGTQFFYQWRNSKFYDHIPLVTVENMAYEDILQDVQHLNIDLYAASSWKSTNQTLQNIKFVKQFEQLHHQPVSVFSMLGYELGILLGNVYQDMIKGDCANAIVKIKNSKLEGPRGLIVIQGFTEKIYPLIDILKIRTDHLNINQTIIDQKSAIGFDTTTIFEDNISGYLNPYFSI